jgi:hypothetical protein
MQKLTLSHPQNAVIAESLPNRTLAELGKLSLMDSSAGREGDRVERHRLDVPSSRMNASSSAPRTDCFTMCRTPTGKQDKRTIQRTTQGLHALVTNSRLGCSESSRSRKV